MATFGDHVINQLIKEWTRIWQETRALSMMFDNAPEMQKIVLRVQLKSKIDRIKAKVDKELAMGRTFSDYENERTPELEKLIAEVLLMLQSMLPGPSGLTYSFGRGEVGRMARGPSKDKGSLADVVKQISEQFQTVTEVPSSSGAPLSMHEMPGVEADPLTAIMILAGGALDMLGRWMGKKRRR